MSCLCWLRLKVKRSIFKFKQIPTTPSPPFLLISAGQNTLPVWRTRVQSRPDGTAQGHASKWLVMWQKVFLTAHMTLHIFMHRRIYAKLGPRLNADKETQQRSSRGASRRVTWPAGRTCAQLLASPEETADNRKRKWWEYNDYQWRITHIDLSFLCDRLQCWLLLILGTINLHDRHNWNWIQDIWE